MSFFTVHDLSAGYRKKTILLPLSFDLKEGSITGILGPNGCGKTTLLKALCGILPHTGSCTLEGTVLETLTPKQLSCLCSYIPQQSGISIDISALDVVLMGFHPHLGLLEHPSAVMKEKAREALCMTGLSGKEEVNYQHLSQGQKQLCILARTLVTGSRLLLLDEPESALDFHHRYHMLKLLRQWVSGQNQSVLVTLHDSVLALNCCDKLLLLSQGKMIDILYPQSDSLDKMEAAFQKIYGDLSIHKIQNRIGQPCFVLVKEGAHDVISD